MTSRIIVTLLGLLSPAAVHAAVIAADTVTASGTGSTAASGSSVLHLNDRTGLSSTLTDANLATVTHVEGFSSATQYLANNGSGGIGGTQITFLWNTALTDALTTIAIWNYSQSGGTAQHDRSADSVDIEINTGSGFVLYSSANLLSQYAGTAHPSTATLINVGSQTGVVGVRLTLHDSNPDNAITGLSEVAFQTVPEPSAALLSGLGLLALLRRRRRP